MLQIQSFVFNDFQENTYIIWDESHQCAIIDPGCANASEQKMLTDFITNNQLNPSFLINTHCHIDHILGNIFVAEKYQLPLHLHEGELFTYKDTDRWAAMFGLPKFEIPENLVFIEENQEITIGNSTLKALFTPGHSIASLSFYNVESMMLIAGDALFHESIGRTDLPGGNQERLVQSIKNVIFALPDETKVYSGHGPITTVGHEKKFNPYVGILS